LSPIYPETQSDFGSHLGLTPTSSNKQRDKTHFLLWLRVCLFYFLGGFEGEKLRCGLVERMLDDDWQRNEDRDVAHPTRPADSRYRLEPRIEIERTWHAYSPTKFPRRPFFCLSTVRAIDKENKTVLKKVSLTHWPATGERVP
jgi:hypothetical protein